MWVLDFFENILTSFGGAVSWLTTEFNVLGVTFSPLMLFTFGGLTLFIGIAITKWVVS